MWFQNIEFFHFLCFLCFFYIIFTFSVNLGTVHIGRSSKVANDEYVSDIVRRVSEILREVLFACKI